MNNKEKRRPAKGSRPIYQIEEMKSTYQPKGRPLDPVDAWWGRMLARRVGYAAAARMVGVHLNTFIRAVHEGPVYFTTEAAFRRARLEEAA
jgi:hypothetical protein